VRQHTTPLLLNDAGCQVLKPTDLTSGEGFLLEAKIQELIHTHPTCLPISEIDPAFKSPIPVCRELRTPAGNIDNFMVTASGMPVVVECKLWRNPEGRRKVVGQILDYAKELSRWSSADLQREVHVNTGNSLLNIVRQSDRSVDEVEFNDNLSLNLRKGRFLLLIVGDGIREGVEAITEYLQKHAGLNFSFGLVEMPLYTMPNGGTLVCPRVIARTTNITREVVITPTGYRVENVVTGNDENELDPDRAAMGDERYAFWEKYLDQLKLDDPEQDVPKPARSGYVKMLLPATNASAWITIYREKLENRVGVMFSSHRNSAGEYAMQVMVDALPDLREELGPTVYVDKKEGRERLADSQKYENLEDPAQRAAAFEWLNERVNTFVNVLRPRVRSAVKDYEESQRD
jgi:hypothetical protein